MDKSVIENDFATCRENANSIYSVERILSLAERYKKMRLYVYFKTTYLMTTVCPQSIKCRNELQSVCSVLCMFYSETYKSNVVDQDDYLFEPKLSFLVADFLIE